MTWNIGGLRKHLENGSLIQYLCSFDIIGLVETWSENTGEFERFLPGFTHFDNVRKRNNNALRNSGGISVFIRNKLILSNLLMHIRKDILDAVVLLIKGSKFNGMKDIILYIAYVSPEGSSIYHNRQEVNGITLLEQNIISLKLEYPDCYLYLAGDFNARTKTFLDYIPFDNLNFLYMSHVDYACDYFEIPRNNQDVSRFNSFGKSLTELCCTHDIHIVNGRCYDDIDGNFTCIANDGQSVVDYHIVSSQLFDVIGYFNVELRTESDHFPLLARMSFTDDIGSKHSINITQNGKETLPNTTYEYCKKTFWKESYKEVFKERFCNQLDLNRESILNEINTSINEGVNTIIQLYKTSACPYSLKTIEKPLQPQWWDRECTVAKDLKYCLLRRFRQTHNLDILIEYKLEKKKFRDLCNRKKMYFQFTNRQSLLNARKDPQRFWSLIKFNNKANSFNNEIKAAAWLDYFESLLYKENQEALSMLDLSMFDINSNSEELLNSPISNEEILRSIYKLKEGKAQGIDGVGAEFYKHTCLEITPILNILFNKILASGDIPDSWCQSIIVPLYKSGSRNDPSNYRGISLLNVLYKIFSGIITHRLDTWADEYNVISEAQAGFRAGYSVIDNIFSLQSIIQKYITRSYGRVYVLYVDFQKAFDSLVHVRMFHSLLKAGANGQIIKVLISMYSKLDAYIKVPQTELISNSSTLNMNQNYNRAPCRFKYSNKNSTPGIPLAGPIHCNIGTRQGDLSSPKIFSLYINDLETHLKRHCNKGIFITNDVPDVFCLMFADDVACCADTVVNLQRQLNSISTFCEETGMTVNLNKSEIIVFRNGGPLRNSERWTYNGKTVKVTNMYKYLGLLFTPKLSWSRSKNKLAAQARKAICSIKLYQKPFGHFSQQEMFKLFDSMVVPILTFGSEIWGFSYSEEIERVQIDFCRYFLGVNTSVNNSVILGECGRLPLCSIYLVKCIKYWCNLLYMPNTRYPKNCYKMLYSLDCFGRRNWAAYIKEILFRHGFGYAWIAQEVGNVNSFIYIFKQRIKDCLSQQWISTISDSTRCDTYKLFKSNLNPEKYISIDLPLHQRKALAKFRCSSHKLKVEIGRHQGIPRELRFCIYCLNNNVQALEDEFHVFLVCPKFSDLRERYILSWYNGGSDKIDFINIMKSENVNSIKQISLYIHKMFQVIENRLE